MINSVRTIELEEKLEDLRKELYLSVNGVPSRLNDSQVLPLSIRLDQLILEVQKAKNKM